MSDECTLAFFVTSSACYAAIQTDTHIIQDRLILGQESQSAVLIPFIQRLWQQIDCPAFTKICAPKGPGSFTSVRVTLAAAQGFSIAFPKAKCFAPTLFDILLFNAPETCYAVIDSKRGDFFVKTTNGEPLILSHTAFMLFQKEHEEWIIRLDPDLLENEVMRSVHIDPSFQPDDVLKALLSAQTYMDPQHEPTIFHPYYLFDPVFKKTKESNLI